jgi:pyruvate kinase
VTFFAKIETSSALDNLGRIFKEVDHVNVDRGDLSTDVGMLKLPAIQERVIESAKRAKKKIYLATQFLKNMELNPVPLIAEVMDLHNTIKSGVSGVQLSEETAIGRFPVECVKLGFDTFHQSFSG